MITLNGKSIEVDEGLPLVEVIKDQGITITNLCYIDGLEPYAGCRTCIVEIEEARPTEIQLACTSKTADGMVIRTETEAVKHTRQGVMSMILANHPDRCLTCHRRVHCMPGDICLRDDVVTHRCLTCSKNYRCELQTSCEIVDMGEFSEPWVGESRSYYETPPPEPDRGNPYLEFDPQMCIICTRCVRACDDLRHTGALTLSGKGHSTMIAFGTGGQIHESDCDFCGACIDVCPTATLMEKPNKWRGLAEDWTNSACNGCSVGCTLSYGTANDQPVIVRPDRINPVSRDQICVRGRFGYTDVPERERLIRSLIRNGDRLLPADNFDQALDIAATSLATVKESAGADAIAVLGSPLATTEEAYVLGRLAREAIGTEHIDFSHGPLHRAVTEAFVSGLGTDQLPANLTDIEKARTIVVIGGDIEESHQVVSLRVKDAVKKHGAKLILISNRWSELVPFSEQWLQPFPGQEAATAQALADGLSSSTTHIPDTAVENTADAIATLRLAIANAESNIPVILAPTAGHGAVRAGGEAIAAVNLSIAIHSSEAAHNLYYLPTDANVIGLTDAGIVPGSTENDFPNIIEKAKNGTIKALVLHNDNPLLNTPGTPDIESALANLEVLIVIDSLKSTATQHATVVLAELPFHAKDGTLTSADRRIIRQRPAGAPQGDEREGIAILTALARALGTSINYDSAADVMRDISSSVVGYVPYDELTRSPGKIRALVESESTTAQQLPAPTVSTIPPVSDGLAIITGRSLFTSWAAASIHSDEADKLHREESALVHPQDAESVGIRNGDQAILASMANAGSELRIRIRLDDGISPGSIYIPHYYDGGALMRLMPLTSSAEPTTLMLQAMQPA